MGRQIGLYLHPDDRPAVEEAIEVNVGAVRLLGYWPTEVPVVAPRHPTPERWAS
jgi:hypothetical protein